MTKILETIGTLQLIDTERWCSTRNVRILRVHCTKDCGDDELLHDAIVKPFWEVTRMLEGYHQGCDPSSDWRKDPVGTKLKRDAMKSLIASPPGSCIACDQIDCTGAAARLT
jgi:hypothetical protein